MSGIGEYVQETTTGHCATLAALVIALEESGVLPKTAYGDTLKRLWHEMPEEAAIGEAGAVIERVLDLLNPPVGPESERQTRPFDRTPVNDDAREKRARIPLRAILTAF